MRDEMKALQGLLEKTSDRDLLREPLLLVTMSKQASHAANRSLVIETPNGIEIASQFG